MGEHYWECEMEMWCLNVFLINKRVRKDGGNEDEGNN